MNMNHKLFKKEDTTMEDTAVVVDQEVKEPGKFRKALTKHKNKVIAVLALGTAAGVGFIGGRLTAGNDDQDQTSGDDNVEEYYPEED